MPVCTVSATMVTIVKTGACSITASQAGNGNYSAASSVTRTFTVTQGAQTIAFGSLSNIAFGTTPFTISATASFGTDRRPRFEHHTRLHGIGNHRNHSGHRHLLNRRDPAGQYYLAAAPVTQTFSVAVTAQSISFGPLGNLVFGAAQFSLTASASSGLPVSFASTTPGVCTVSGFTATSLRRETAPSPPLSRVT